MKRDYDVAVVGAGLAGLSLAVRLAALPQPPQILIIDPRTMFERDRTWCTWAVESHPFGGCVSHRWPGWTVGTGQESVTRRSGRFPYQRIPADALYQKARRLLEKAASVTWALGQSVVALRETPEHVEIALADGDSVEARQVYDSRPPEIQPSEGWRQIFLGLEIRCPGAVWDLEKVVLMDFRQADADGVRFFYLLPLSSDTFLVEDTWLCPAGKTPEFSDEDILAYANGRVGGSGMKILHRESGTIPMFAQPKPDRIGRITSIGTRGGAVRSSSGYAFTRIQQESGALAAAYPNRPKRGKRTAMLPLMDAVFLDVLDRHPEHLPLYLERLFERVKPDRLIRFMESCPSWLDYGAVITALPPWPFMKSLGSSLYSNPSTRL